MSYYKNTKKVEKMFARLTTGGSNPAMAGETKEIKETVERALLPIELSDRVSPTLDVPIAPMIASYRYASGFGSAYSKLFSPIVADDPEDMYISCILTKVFFKGVVDKNLLAFGIGVAQSLLSPKYEKITIEEKIMKDRIEKKVAILLNKGTFVISVMMIVIVVAAAAAAAAVAASSNSEDMQDQPTGTPEDTEDQVAVSKTTSVQEISNTPEKCSGPESSEVQQET
ncbi:hypothetical protein C2G38_2216300 [Gigaspora rosea]|uniref:Uncharacterized protein n=1 Tax=Gigaspora rosea TaxID=44941 RepID=A0A397UCE3_9GLOM|nr:hypothetical protein C2G38_2216300 [Gigaspora rosea]